MGGPPFLSPSRGVLELPSTSRLSRMGRVCCVMLLTQRKRQQFMVVRLYYTSMHVRKPVKHMWDSSSSRLSANLKRVPHVTQQVQQADWRRSSLYYCSVSNPRRSFDMSRRRCQTCRFYHRRD